MMHLTLEQGSSLSTMLLVMAGAIALAGFFYYRAFRSLKKKHFTILFALRTLSILFVILLLFRPVLLFQKENTRRPSLIFLLDRSASMSIADDATGQSRYTQALSLVEKWEPKLQNAFNLHWIAFADTPQLLSDPNQFATLLPDGQSTSLSRALIASAKVAKPEEVEAVLLLSDGIHNAARNPLEIAGKLDVPVHTIGIGTSLRNNNAYRDLQVTSIDAPDRLILKNLARITASVEGINLAGRVIRPILEQDGKQIAETELTLDNLEGTQSLTFEFRPTEKGKHTYTVRIPPTGEEKILENNHRSATSLVVQPGIRVLYLEGTLRAEYGALVDRFLAKDPDLEFCALVQTRPNVFLQRTNMENLSLTAIPNDEATWNRFDVIILGDLDSSYLREPQQEMLVKHIRNGAGLLMLGGYHSLGPGGYANTPLGNILPVLLGPRDIGQFNEKFLPRLTPEGVRHPIFANIADFFPTTQGEAKPSGLPKLSGCTRVEATRPGASILATVDDQAQSMPVLAVQPVEKGRTAVFTADTTRRWQQASKALDLESPFNRFWGQTIRWLADRSETLPTSSGVTASLDKAAYEPQEPIHIAATVRDENGQGTNDAKVKAKILLPNAETEEILLILESGSPGHYTGSFEPTTSGTYSLEVQAQRGDNTLIAEKIQTEVGRANLEFEKLDFDDRMLQSIAAESKGHYYHSSTADLLLSSLDRSTRKRTELLEYPLYSSLLLWSLFVVAVSIEWIMRRRFQLR